MGFTEAIKTCFNKYATFQGRASRSEYWYWCLFYFLIFILTEVPYIEYLALIAALLVVIPSISVGVRRLHDIGKSGWWYLVAFIPLIGGLILLYFAVLDSQPGENQYGPNPKGL